MTSDTMQPPTDTSKLVRDHLRASKKVMKKVLRSKKAARAFLVEAGILTKSGKLSKRYRPD
jgi:hypothetical protein